MRKVKPLTRVCILSNAAYRESGLRRWDISEEITLFYALESAWYDGPLWYEGWTLVVSYDTNDGRGGWLPVKITHTDAWNILADKYREWEKEDDSDKK